MLILLLRRYVILQHSKIGAGARPDLKVLDVLDVGAENPTTAAARLVIFDNLAGRERAKASSQARHQSLSSPILFDQGICYSPEPQRPNNHHLPPFSPPLPLPVLDPFAKPKDKRVATMTSTIGIPIKLLNEAQGHIVTLEIDSGTTYRGKLIEGAPSPPTHLSHLSSPLSQNPLAVATVAQAKTTRDPLANFPARAHRLLPV